jgi:hypothetical protein
MNLHYSTLDGASESSGGDRYLLTFTQAGNALPHEQNKVIKS